MIRRFLMPTLLVGLASCTASPQAPAESARPAATSSVEQASSLPNVQCRGEIPETLQATFGEFRLAQPDDFIAKIREFDQNPGPPGKPKITYTCSIFVADFNQDGQQDYAALLVNPKTQTAQFRLAINQDQGTFENAVIRDYPKPPQPIAEPLYVAMFLKRSGELGTANREYFPLEGGTAERETFIASPAIELWLSPAVYRSGTSPSQSEEERFNQTVGYGSEIFYFVDRELKTTRVAD
ncbi:hypothetical protein [Leptolyngbya sp. FACHB-261]|uniref:hypothetical protein n=1 Tax=Leptolyngbya sp. FACHB-261 TaxID=2692806 RepID=UPI0016854237|nr:hypothetical protein [Leptolyngbya sp. FACHB-261]MBD2102331.1 hypothetical protein [Leptolyngbya sp. FACHB-261]